jgi:hypothetical protein
VRKKNKGRMLCILIKKNLWGGRIDYVPLMAKKTNEKDSYSFRQLCHISFIGNKSVMQYANTDVYYEKIKTGTPYFLECDISGTPFCVIFSKLKDIEINLYKINKGEK